MPKTVFGHDSFITPEYMNAIQNPTYVVDPQNDGQFPIPPQIEAEATRATASENAIATALNAETVRALAAEQALVRTQVLSSGANAVAIHATSALYLSAQESYLRAVKLGEKAYYLQVGIHFNYSGSDWNNSFGPSWAIQCPSDEESVLGSLWNALSDPSIDTIPFGPFNLGDQSYVAPFTLGGQLSLAAGAGFGAGFSGLRIYAISNGTWASSMSGKIDLFGAGMVILP